MPGKSKFGLPSQADADVPRTSFVWELHMNIFAALWRKTTVALALDGTDVLPYDSLLQYSRDLLESHQNFLAIKATQELDEQESFAFAIVYEFVRHRGRNFV